MLEVDIDPNNEMMSKRDKMGIRRFEYPFLLTGIIIDNGN
jgi:hypothetical protein